MVYEMAMVSQNFPRICGRHHRFPMQHVKLIYRFLNAERSALRQTSCVAQVRPYLHVKTLELNICCSERYGTQIGVVPWH